MKISKFSILICFSFVLVSSCSDEETDNGNTNGNPDMVSSDFFPNTLNSYWKYDVANVNNDLNELSITNDSLYVASQNIDMFALDANDGLPANGVMSGFLTSGNLTPTNQTLVLDGTLELPTEIADAFDFNVTLTNLILFDTSAQNNTALSLNSDVITQDFNGFPITIEYELSTKSLGSLTSIVANDLTYNDIIGSELALNVSVSTTIDFAGFPITINILEPQDVLVSTYYFANNIGMVQSTSQINYQISDAAIAAIEATGQTLPIPTSSSSSNNENLISYLIAE